MRECIYLSNEKLVALKGNKMRKADETSVEMVHGLMLKIETWVDWTDIPWDGCEPLETGAEGYDILVEATIVAEGVNVTGYDSLGSIWIMPNREGLAYLGEEKENVKKQAITNAFDELGTVAAGVDVARAKNRQAIAKGLLKKSNREAREPAKVKP